MTPDSPDDDPPPSSGLTMVSMKSPVGVDAVPRAPVLPVKRQVKIRAISEVDGLTAAPQRPTGNLAPPRDETRARKRSVTFALGWSVLALLLAGAVSVAIYVVATR